MAADPKEGLPGLSLDEIGKIMHESWAATKRAQGFHGPYESCPIGICCEAPQPFWCAQFHHDLIPWEQLPEKQKDINRHAFDALLPRIQTLITTAKVEAFLAACQAECVMCEGGAWVHEDGGTWYHKTGEHCFAWRTRNAAKEAGMTLPQFCDLGGPAASADSTSTTKP